MSLAAVASFSVGANELAAQEQARVQFEPGRTSATINDAVRGSAYRDYVVSAQCGQTMVVSLAVTGTNGNGSAFFNILPAGLDYDGLYVGSTDPDRRAEVTIPRDGDWVIRVYLMGNDRDTDRTVGYSIDVYITPVEGAARQPDPGSGTFEVVGVSSNDVLNVRSGPGVSFGIVGALAGGDRVRRLGCEDQGGSRWCEIEMLTDMRERGGSTPATLSMPTGAPPNCRARNETSGSDSRPERAEPNSPIRSALACRSHIKSARATGRNSIFASRETIRTCRGGSTIPTVHCSIRLRPGANTAAACSRAAITGSK